jgi:hypothetical protein
MSNQNITPKDDLLGLASRVGSSIAGELGETSFITLELALVTRLFPKKFTDLPTLRTRSHVILYWFKGFYKSTLLTKFAETIPKQFKVISLTSATTEILKGSINSPKVMFEDPRIIPPNIAGVDFGIITEHMSFLKNGGLIDGKLNLLNDILEGDRVSNSLVKLGQVKIDENQKPELEKLKVQYDPEGATITYEPDIIILTASRPLDIKTLSLLVNSGHFERFKVCQIRITSEMAQRYLKTNFALNQVLHERLKQENEQLCKVKINSIETAPETLLNPIYDAVCAELNIPDARIKGDILRAAAAHMVLRNRSQGYVKEQYTKSDYTNEDIAFVLGRINEFIEPRISPLVSDDQIKIGKPLRKRDEAKDLIISFLQTAKQSGKIGEQLAALHAMVEKQIPGVHYQTVVNAVNELVQEGVVERVPEAHGFYNLVEKEGN